MVRSAVRHIGGEQDSRSNVLREPWLQRCAVLCRAPRKLRSRKLRTGRTWLARCLLSLRAMTRGAGLISLLLSCAACGAVQRAQEEPAASSDADGTRQ
jgi:hypothetical protein